MNRALRSYRPLYCLLYAGLAACNHEPRLALDYQLSSTLDPAVVSRVETRVAVAASDPRHFAADIPFRAVDVGVGYEVRDFDGDGARTLLITHDASLGYTFSPAFTFTLLPPVGDAPPLEISARAIGASASDILAQTGAVEGTFGGDNSLTLSLADLRCGALTCSGNTSCCGGGCVNTATSVKHCGACDKDCGQRGDACSGGACRCNGGSACGADTSCCPGVGCVSTTTDPFNCGACGKVCPAGDTCENGSCTCKGKSCATGEVCCDGTCTAGGCACGAQGACSPTTPLCCGGSCTDVATDEQNCGVCGKSCTGSDQCVAGHCRCNGDALCSPGDTCCPGGCAHLDDDPKNCGACGRTCGAGETCAQGVCRCGTGSECVSAGRSCCVTGNGNRSCVSTATDRDHCGACGKSCAATEQCQNGRCVCPGTNEQCGPNQTCCPNVGCFDLANDAQHCGQCAKVCGIGESCSLGSCQTGPVLCVPSCVNGTTCIGGKCFCNGLPARCDGQGQYCCPGAGCVDTTSDPRHCGKCDGDCKANNAPLCCNGSCTLYDQTHCGSCATVCSTGQQCCFSPSGGIPTCNSVNSGIDCALPVPQ